MPSVLTDRHIDRLWERMAKIYGHKWVSSYGEADDGSWLTGLHDVAVEQIAVGLEKCRVSSDPWPPTLPQFRALCRPEKTPAYHRDYIALPKPMADKEKVADAIAEMRKVLR